MIESLALSNFKCFKDVLVPLRDLTVLSGINGMGKSTCIQAMLMLRQSVLEANGTKLVADLNGSLVRLGLAEDVLFDKAEEEDTIALAIHEDGAERRYTFSYAQGAKLLQPGKGSKAAKRGSRLFGEDFYYLAAERLGPRNSFPSSDMGDRTLNPIGNSGEYCAWLLARHERDKIEQASLYHPDPDTLHELRSQVEAWLSEISQSARVHLSEHAAMDLINLQFSFIRDGVSSNRYRPTNVGFGLTYTLPIFVASLLANPGGLLIVENPEAHLHPKGQAIVGRFLAMVAASGVQVILETHSDHLLNGVRIAAKRKLIAPDQVALNFFQPSTDAQSTEVVTPVMDQDGRLDQWPEGFFDEWENGLAELL